MNVFEELRRDQVLAWLRERDRARIEALFRAADTVRHECVGDEVHLRGLIEFGNVCERECLYCGLRAGNRRLPRYMMSSDEIMACAREAVSFGYGTVVLQSGEQHALPAAWIAEVVAQIKAETTLAVTLSLGERPAEDLRLWKQAGADRYLIRFETGDPALFARLHPPRPSGGRSRLEMLRELRELGYEVGSGIMTGIPGQTYESLADDIIRFRDLDLDMIGIGPWVLHPDTPLGQRPELFRAPAGEQVPHTEDLALRVIALTRLVCPFANIPATTAIATVNRDCGRELALQRGANIVMPILTPTLYRPRYEIYPSRACASDSPSHCHLCLRNRLTAIDRIVGQRQGSSPNWKRRTALRFKSAAPDASAAP